MGNQEVFLIIITLSLGLNLVGCGIRGENPPQGKIVFREEESSEIYVMNTDGTEKKKLAKSSHYFLSPDGKIFFQKEEQGDSTIYVMNIDGTKRKRLTKGVIGSLSLDGRKVCFILNSKLYIMNVDGTTEAKMLIEGEFTWPFLSPDGKKIFLSKATHRIPQVGFSIINTDGSDEKQIPIDNLASGPNFSFSPDGKKVLFESVGFSPIYECAYTHIEIMNIDGTNQRRLTRNEDNYVIGSFSFSPDSKKIIFTSVGDHPEDFRTMIMDVDSTDKKVLLKKATHLGFTPDGKKIIFKAKNPFFKGYGIYIMNLDGTRKRKITDCPEGAHSFSFFWANEKKEEVKADG